MKKWPVDPSREGRDLGEFLRTIYVKSFEEQAKSNVIINTRSLDKEDLASDIY